MSEDLITKLAVAFLTCAWIGELVKGWYQRRKVRSSAVKEEADGAQIIVTSAKALLGPLNKRIKEMEAETNTLRQNLTLANTELARVNTQVYNMTRQMEECTAENKRVTIENRRLRQLLAGEAT